MAFGLERKIFSQQLRNLGAIVKDSPTRNHYLLVNDKYEVCYTNFYFRKVGEEETLGQGKQSFLNIIKSECNKS